MKRSGIRFFVITVLASLLLTGCGAAEDRQEKERKEIDFTVVEREKLPAQLLQTIEENKAEEIRMTYTDGEDMYLIRGYGEQKTGGYSIAVVQCTEDEEKIYFDTRLIGPEEQEKPSGEPSYPYLAVKIETREKEAVIQ